MSFQSSYLKNYFKNNNSLFENILEDILEPAIVPFQNSILRRQIQRPFLLQRHLKFKIQMKHLYKKL